MTSYDADETWDRRMDALRRLAPESARAERVRARCHRQLERRERRHVPAGAMTGRARRALAPMVVGGLCLVYLIAFVVTTLRVEGVLR